jgi:hypothetical protein
VGELPQKWKCGGRIKQTYAFLIDLSCHRKGYGESLCRVTVEAQGDDLKALSDPKHQTSFFCFIMPHVHEISVFFLRISMEANNGECWMAGGSACIGFLSLAG